MTIDQMIAVLQAAKAGNQIQLRARSPEGRQWCSVHWDDAGFDFSRFDYRVAPDAFDEWWAGYSWQSSPAHGTDEAFEKGCCRAAWDAAIKSMKQ